MTESRLVTKRWLDEEFSDSVRQNVQDAWNKRKLTGPLDLRGIPLLSDNAPNWLDPLDLISMEVEGVDFSHALMTRSLAGSTFQSVRFTGSSFDHPSFFDSSLVNCQLYHCRMTNPDMPGAAFTDCDFTSSSVKGRGGLPSHDAGKRVTFVNCCFRRAVFDFIKIGGARFERCTLDQAFFRRCYVFNWKFVDCIGLPVFEGCEYKGLNVGLPSLDAQQ